MASKTVRIVFGLLLASCLLLGLSSASARAVSLNGGPVRAAANMAGSSSAFPLYAQPHDGAGALLPSSRLIGSSSDSDQYVWDDFLSFSATTITEVRWRGARDMTRNTGGPVQYFTIEIYPDIASRLPDVNQMLFQYPTPGNAGETFAGTFGGVAMYDYDAVLPNPFTTQANTRYWLKIEAFQNQVPDWGIASGTSGRQGYYRGWANAGDLFYSFGRGGSAFTLYQPGNPSYLYMPVVQR